MPPGCPLEVPPGEKVFAELGVGGAWVGALYYADDLALVAESAGEMQKMLRVVDRYCREWHFQPSFDKTKVLRFGKAAKDATPLYLPSMHHTKPPPSVGHVDGGLGTDTNPVSVAAEYPYLGVVVHDKRGFTRHVEEVVVPAMQAALVDVFDYAEVQGGLPLDGAQAVVRAVVQSKAAHGAGVWAPVDVATGRGSRLALARCSRAGGPDPQVPGGCTSMAWWNGGPHAKAAASTSNFRTDTCCRCGGVFASSSDALFTSMYWGPSITRSWWPRNYAPFSTACTMSHSMSAARRARVRHLCVLRRRGPGLGQ